MANSKRRKGKGKFVMIEKYMFDSDAWMALSCVDRCLYLEFLKRYDGFNNGRIGFSCREAVALLRIGKSTASRSFKNLEDKGFIEVTKRSGFNIKGRVSNEHRLTEYKCDITGELPTKKFVHWRPDEKSTVPPQVRTVPSQVRKRQKAVPKPPHSPTTGTVKPKNEVSQSHHRYTYRYTIQEGDDGQPTV